MRNLLLALAAAMLVLILPAAADDAETVTACLAAELKVGRDGRGCIDRVADACIRETKAETTTAMVECVDRGVDAWDKVLNADYQDLLKLLPGPAAESVRKAQRAWIALRDADCAVPYDIFEGGTMARIDSVSCVQNHTASRVLQLRIWRQMAQPE
jgi:uncharacterized protein YecT (DUF1311 family)